MRACVHPSQKHFVPYGDSLFDFDLILFPVNVRNNHWVLVAIDLDAKNIDWYDSSRDIAGGADSMNIGKRIILWLRTQYSHPSAPGPFIKKGTMGILHCAGRAGGAQPFSTFGSSACNVLLH